MRSERAVHETLQHAGVQHVVRCGMRFALCVQFIQRGVKRKPFADAGGQLAFALELLVDLEVFPTGIVLHRSDAPLCCLLQGTFDRLATFVVIGLGNYG